MALIICPECGKQVSNRALSCPNCGYPITPSLENDNNSHTSSHKQIKKKRKRPILLIVIIISIMIAITIVFYQSVLSPEAKLEKAYAEACDLYNNKEYKQALIQFEPLGNYRNSADVVKWCKYGIAQEHITSKEWESAINYLSEIDYKNSDELILLCKYNQGIEAMGSFDWLTAVSFFSDLEYQESEKMLLDCSFMIALEESVLRRMEASAKENSDFRSLVSTELAYLDRFRNADFYDSAIRIYAKKYLDGLDMQLSSLTYKLYSEYQHDWNAGIVMRYEVLSNLYEKYGFMADNKDFIGEYVNQLEYHKKWLKEFESLERNGHKSVKEPIGTNSYVEYYFKNNTNITSTQTFDITFWKDKDGKQLLGTSSITVEDIGPYEEYTVRVYIPAAAQNINYWFNWSNWYNDIKI